MLKMMRGVYAPDARATSENQVSAAMVIADNSPIDSVAASPLGCRVQPGAPAPSTRPLPRCRVLRSNASGVPASQFTSAVPPDRRGRLAVCIVCAREARGIHTDRVT